MELEQLDNIIKSSKNILITSHINPDGDTLGSMCAMYNFIKLNYKKNCDMLVVSRIPKTYNFIPNINLCKHIDEIDKSREYDLTINVDIAAIDRICEGEKLFNKSKHTINIDHHKTNIRYGEINIVDDNASSTAEVVMDIARNLNWKIDTEIATCLYVGILTDTGSFRFENTTPKCLKFASKLIEMGVNPSDMYQKCYETQSKNMVLFQSYCVNKAIFKENDRIAYTIVYKKDMERFQAEEDYTDGLAEKLRAINSTEIAFVAKELGTITKISMRSKVYDVSQICEKFGGGGHKCAAGCTIKSNVENAVKKLLAEIGKVSL